MGIFLKDIDYYEDAQAAARNGMYGALGFAGLLAFSIAMVVSGAAGIPLERLTATGQFIVLGIMGLELALALLAAWRFGQSKGLITGLLTMAVFLFEIGAKLIGGGFLGLLWYAIYLAIFLGLINGLRGAWALRTMGNSEEVAETFE